MADCDAQTYRLQRAAELGNHHGHPRQVSVYRANYRTVWLPPARSEHLFSQLAAGVEASPSRPLLPRHAIASECRRAAMSIQKMTISPSKKSVAVDLLAMIYNYIVGACMSCRF
jgi:hypothetical protein